MTRSTSTRWWLAGFCAAGVALAAVLSQAMAEEQDAHEPALAIARKARGPLPLLWRVPRFEMRSQRNDLVSDVGLRGHSWIASFLFTSCGSVCPTLSAKIALLQRKLPQPSMRFVSFSVDPERDTPARLAAYAQRFRPDERRWLLLSAGASELEKVLRGMHVSAEPSGDVQSPIAHSALLFLVDRNGWVRGVYDSSDAAGEALASLERDARSLENDASRAPSSIEGAVLYRELGCDGCHAEPRLAPPLKGLMGTRAAIADEGQAEVDVAYLRESIVAPSAKLVSGYHTSMPSYESELTREELDALVLYVSRL